MGLGTFQFADSTGPCDAAFDEWLGPESDGTLFEKMSCNVRYMARSALLNIDTEDLKELLSNGKGYRVPRYQRDYSWKQEHWEDLWEDIESAEKTGDDHYMGSIVLEFL